MIPKIFHHIWMGDKQIPDTCKTCYEQMKTLHPEFEFKLWRDSDIDYLLKTKYQKYYTSFHNLPRTIMKIDMFRYFLMYEYGGIYTDLDYYFLKPYDIFDYKVVIPCNRENEFGEPIRLGNCIFSSEAKHPFWKHLIDTLFTIDRTNIEYNNDNTIDCNEFGTGPTFVYSMWIKHKTGIFVPIRKLFHPETKLNNDYIHKLQIENISYGMHVCTGLWRQNKL